MNEKKQLLSSAVTKGNINIYSVGLMWLTDWLKLENCQMSQRAHRKKKNRKCYKKRRKIKRVKRKRKLRTGGNCRLISTQKKQRKLHSKEKIIKWKETRRNITNWKNLHICSHTNKGMTKTEYMKVKDMTKLHKSRRK